MIKWLILILMITGIHNSSAQNFSIGEPSIQGFNHDTISKYRIAEIKYCLENPEGKKNCKTEKYNSKGFVTSVAMQEGEITYPAARYSYFFLKDNKTDRIIYKSGDGSGYTEIFRFGYDSAGRPNSISFSDNKQTDHLMEHTSRGKSVNYTYYPDGNLKEIMERKEDSDVKTIFSYDKKGNIISEKTITDKYENRTGEEGNIYPTVTREEKEIKRTFNSLNQPTEISFITNDTTSYNYEYDHEGKKTRVTVKRNGKLWKETTFIYGENDQLIKTLSADNKTYTTVSFSHTRDGKILEEKRFTNDTILNYMATYSYHANGKLKSEKRKYATYQYIKEYNTSGLPVKSLMIPVDGKNRKESYQYKFLK